MLNATSDGASVRVNVVLAHGSGGEMAMDAAGATLSWEDGQPLSLETLALATQAWWTAWKAKRT